MIEYMRQIHTIGLCTWRERSEHKERTCSNSLYRYTYNYIPVPVPLLHQLYIYLYLMCMYLYTCIPVLVYLYTCMYLTGKIEFSTVTYVTVKPYYINTCIMCVHVY